MKVHSVRGSVLEDGSLLELEFKDSENNIVALKFDAEKFRQDERYSDSVGYRGSNS